MLILKEKTLHRKVNIKQQEPQLLVIVLILNQNVKLGINDCMIVWISMAC